MATQSVQWLTIWIVAIAVVTAALVDLALAWSKGSSSTISHVVLDLSRRYPMIPFSVGVLIGHLFFPQ